MATLYLTNLEVCVAYHPYDCTTQPFRLEERRQSYVYIDGYEELTRQCKAITDANDRDAFMVEKKGQAMAMEKVCSQSCYVA